MCFSPIPDFIEFYRTMGPRYRVWLRVRGIPSDKAGSALISGVSAMFYYFNFLGGGWYRLTHKKAFPV